MLSTLLSYLTLETSFRKPQTRTTYSTLSSFITSRNSRFGFPFLRVRLLILCSALTTVLRRKREEYGFYPHSGITINCFAGVEDGEVDNMYFGDETGFVYQADTGNNDGGLPIDRFVTRVFGGRQGSGKYVSSGFPHRKQFANAETFINPSGTGVDVVPSYALNLLNYSDVRTSGNYTNLDTETIDDWTGTGVKRKRIPFFGTSGYSLAFKLRHYAVGENITLFPSELNYKWKKKNLID